MIKTLFEDSLKNYIKSLAISTIRHIGIAKGNRICPCEVVHSTLIPATVTAQSSVARIASTTFSELGR